MNNDQYPYNNGGGYNNSGGYNNNMNYGNNNGGNMNNGFQTPPPNNNLVLAIFTTVCCCMPLGIYAIIKASNVEKYWNMGQHDLALKEANDAKKWSQIGIGVGVVLNIFWAILYSFMIKNAGGMY